MPSFLLELKRNHLCWCPFFAAPQLPCFAAEVKPSSLLHFLSNKVFLGNPSGAKCQLGRGNKLRDANTGYGKALGKVKLKCRFFKAAVEVLQTDLGKC